MPALLLEAQGRVVHQWTISDMIDPYQLHRDQLMNADDTMSDGGQS